MLVFALLFEHHAIPCTPCFPCADPGFFVRGGGGGGVRVNLTKKALTTFLAYFTGQMVNFEENYHFSRFQRGSNIFQGGLTFSKGVQLLIPYRNPYNL